jgi:hypothetical protein
MLEYLQSPNIRKLLFSLLTIFIAYIISLLISRIVNKTVVDLKKRYTARKAVVYIVSALAIINIVLIWLKEQTSIAHAVRDRRSRPDLGSASARDLYGGLASASYQKAL